VTVPKEDFLCLQGRPPPPAFATAPPLAYCDLARTKVFATENAEKGMKMACQVILELRTKEDCVDKARSWFKSVLPDTREFDGCIGLYLVKNQDDPQNFVIIEQWDTRAQYEKYLAWRTERGDIDALVGMIDGEPSIRFFDYLQI
jgi:quinol monooxygenase YgiN